MKLNLKGIRFNLWFSFFFFAVLVLFLLGSFQFLLIKPHFKENKTSEVKKIFAFIKHRLIKNKNIDQVVLNDIFKTTLDNDICVLILNKKVNRVYFSDAIGEICVLNDVLEYDKQIYNFKKGDYKILELLDNNELNISYKTKNTNKEMFLYGKKISDNYENFYLFINSPLEPIDSYLKFIISQYLYFTLLIIVISLLFAYFLSYKFSKPLIAMKKNAEILAQGNYQNVKFNGGYYSEYQVLANSLNDTTDKLAKIDMMRKEFIANISHDIKTPLTMIEAYSEMIKDISGEITLKRNEHLDIIINEVKYLDKLVFDLLELSKLQTQNYVLKKENFELKDLILNTAKNYEEIILKRNLSFKYDLIPAIIFADKLKITQVINNYLSNAIIYSKDNDIIEIKVVDLKDRYRISVIDQGQGIPLELQPYVWDRYYKIDKNFKRNNKQTGLGLAIVKAIIDAHKGKCGLKSTLNKGSEFYFELFKNIEVEDEIR